MSFTSTWKRGRVQIAQLYNDSTEILVYTQYTKQVTSIFERQNGALLNILYEQPSLHKGNSPRNKDVPQPYCN